MVVAFLKPVIFVWATLNAVDDLTMLFRVARLGAVLMPGQSESDLCNVCDDVMGDLLKGTDGLEALPCNWACLKVPKCVEMCERVKASAANSSHYPCIAAGYCNAVEEGEADTDVECEVGAFFSCKPARYCKRKRSGFRFSCELRPGIGRWIGMKNAVGTHAAALADGLFSQPHCGEVGAGPYCIATPRGTGAVCEGLGHVLSVIYGGFKTIASIESPGGDDDRQWLTFWLILTLLLFVERYLARIVLSTFPLYYHAKLLGLCWLLFQDGADDVYRLLRRLVMRFFVFGKLLRKRQLQADWEELTILRRDCHDLVEAALGEEKQRRRALKADRRFSIEKRRLLAQDAGGDAKDVAKDWFEEPLDDGDGKDSPKKKDDDDLLTREDSMVDSIVAVVLGEGTSPRKLEVAKAELANRESAQEVEDALFVVSSYLLTEEGGKALSKLNLTASAKGLLMERAAARVSFQPRFLAAELLGTADDLGDVALLPAMDSNGKTDPYLTCRLIAPEGTRATAYPPRGVSTGVLRCTTKPQWNQSIELTLKGGAIDADGMFRSNEVASDTQLLVQAYDFDVGVWGWLGHASRTAGVLLVIATVFAYAGGLTDELTNRQVFYIVGAAASLVGVAILSFFAAYRWGSDDDHIGEALMPLSMLMDQRTHQFVLYLRPPKAGEKGAPPLHKNRNAKDGLGAIRVRLAMSER